MPSHRPQVVAGWWVHRWVGVYTGRVGVVVPGGRGWYLAWPDTVPSLAWPDTELSLAWSDTELNWPDTELSLA